MKTVYAFVIILFTGLLATRASAQVEIFMKLTDRNGNMINGESQVPNYVGWTELLSTANSLAAIVNLNGTATTRANVDTFPIQMRLSNISIPFTQNILTGSSFNAVDIWFRKAAGATTTCSCAYYKIHMELVGTDNIIHAVDSSGITQQINLVPRRVAWAYYRPNADGTVPAAPTNSYNWDFVANTSFSYSF